MSEVSITNDEFIQKLKGFYLGTDYHPAYIKWQEIKKTYFDKEIVAILNELLETLEGSEKQEFLEFFRSLYLPNGFLNPVPLYEEEIEEGEVSFLWRGKGFYYLKTDRLYQELEIEREGHRFRLLLGEASEKQGNEKIYPSFFFVRYMEDTIEIRVDFLKEEDDGNLQKLQIDIEKHTGKQIPMKVLQYVRLKFLKAPSVDYFISKNPYEYILKRYAQWRRKREGK